VGLLVAAAVISTLFRRRHQLKRASQHPKIEGLQSARTSVHHNPLWAESDLYSQPGSNQNFDDAYEVAQAYAQNASSSVYSHNDRSHALFRFAKSDTAASHVSVVDDSMASSLYANPTLRAATGEHAYHVPEGLAYYEQPVSYHQVSGPEMAYEVPCFGGDGLLLYYEQPVPLAFQSEG
jgi:hypothetical protein